jgi:hypothetical protein
MIDLKKSERPRHLHVASLLFNMHSWTCMCMWSCGLELLFESWRPTTCQMGGDQGGKAGRGHGFRGSLSDPPAHYPVTRVWLLASWSLACRVVLYLFLNLFLRALITCNLWSLSFPMTRHALYCYIISICILSIYDRILCAPVFNIILIWLLVQK